MKHTVISSVAAFGVAIAVLLHVAGCRGPVEVDVYPDYASPTGEEILRIQQSKISQSISIEHSKGDTPTARAETLIKEFISERSSSFAPVTYEYDERGVVKEGNILYQRGGNNQLLVLYQPGIYLDTLFTNEQGFVRRTAYSKSNYKPGGHQYTYNAAGYLIEEFIPSLYISSSETNYQINIWHEYENGNRIRSVFRKKQIWRNQVRDSVVVTFTYNTKLINSGLPYADIDVLFTTVGYNMVNRLEKYHPSFYGKLNRNLPVTATAHYLKSGYDPASDRSLHNFSYTFNANQQVESMFLTRRFETAVTGFYETYKYRN